MDPVSAAEGGVQLFKAVVDRIKTVKQYTQTNSLIDIAKVARVEPLVLLDSDCIHLDYMSDVMQSLQSIFAGYYLQAVSLLGTTVSGVSVAKKLAPLNPSGLSSGIGDWRMSLEAYKYNLPSHKHLSVSLENKDNKPDGMFINDKATSDVKEAVALSIGKIYNVTIRSDNQTAVVPVSIRLLANTLPSNSLADMFTFKNSFDTDLKERYHSWKSGRISFFKDLILCKDLIDKHRSALLKDKSDIYQQIIGRETDAKINGLIGKNPSLAVASNIAIISSDTVSLIETKISGKLKDSKVRKAIFDNTNLMILAVIDKSWERVTYYYRGINESSTLSIKDIKSSNKGSDNTVDFLKAFLQGTPPSL